MERRHISFLLFIFSAISVTVPAQDRYRSTIDTVFQSSSLQQEQHILIVLPNEYQSGATNAFPLILIPGNQEKNSNRLVRETVNYLTENNQIPASVMVFTSVDPATEHTSVSKENSLTVQQELFLINELIPFIRQHYSGTEVTILAGQQQYADLCLQLVSLHPENIQGVIADNPDLTPQSVKAIETIHSYSLQSKSPHTLYLRSSFGQPYAKEYAIMNDFVQKHPPGKSIVNTGCDYYKEANSYSSFGLYFGKALYEIFAVWSSNQDSYFESGDKSPAGKVLQIESNNNTHYGGQLPLSLAALNGKGWLLYNEGKYAEAIESWELLLQRYPGFSEALLYIAYARKDLMQPVDSVLRQFEENFRSSRLYSEEERIVLINEYELLLSIPDQTKE